MQQENECKIPIGSRSEVASSLRKLGAIDEGDVFERNWIFDTPDNRLRKEKKLLRLRQDERGLATFKGPPLPGTFKRREEQECEVSDIETLRAIFERIGFSEMWYYEKRRHSFSLEGCHIALDLVPELGSFIEVEGPSEDMIETTLAKLRLDPANHMRDSYLGLFQAQCRDEEGTLRSMRFDNKHPEGKGIE
jgi:adenylate cyclase, class 2